MNATLLSVAILFSALSFIVSLVSLYMFWQRRARFTEIRDYLERIVKYGDGLADIHATMKDMNLEHHELVAQMIVDAKDEIIKQISYTLRWGEVLSKLIRVGDQSPEYAIASTDPLRKAEQMHEIGIQIAEVAFDEKNAIEKEDAATKVAEAEAVQDELDSIKEELRIITPDAPGA